MRYRVSSGKLTVGARSTIHNTTTVWDKITGEVDASPDAIEQATATFSVDMTSFDAGDWLRNRKLRKDFELEAYPTATFQLSTVSEVTRDRANGFTATATGTLRWRGKDVVLVLNGRGTLDDKAVRATATFTLDITKLGLAAPKMFVFKMDDVVTIDVAIGGNA